MWRAGVSKKILPSPWIVRVARGHVRLWIAIVLAVVVFVTLPDGWNQITRLLIAWDTGLLFYLVDTAVMMARSSAADIRSHAAARDEGAVALTVLTVVAAFASLGAIFVELAAARDVRGFSPYVVAISTVVLSWTFTHTIFALHYTYEFYGAGKRANGLEFPDDDKPDYWDFVYFSFVIGTTFQVSDVAINNKGIRRLVSAHGVLAFFFNTTIIALAVSMAANAI
jgi:uncharacterized membrane protein